MVAVTKTEVETLHRCSSQQGLLLSWDSPAITSYTSKNKDGKSYHKTTSIPTWVIQCPIPSERCFLLLSALNLCRVPVLPILPVKLIDCSCLISFPSVNSHIGPTSHFSSAYLPFHLQNEKNRSEMKAVTLWLSVLMNVQCLIALGRGHTTWEARSC